MKQKDPETTKKGKCGVVRLERNVDSLPIWAPKAYAGMLERTYTLSWKGEGAEVQVMALPKYGQLRSLDKLVLTALIYLWNEQGRRADGRIAFQIAGLIKLLGHSHQGGRVYRRIKQSLRRLKHTGLQFINCFYDKQEETYKTTRDTNILYELLIVEPKKDQTGYEWTVAYLNLDVANNLLGNYTRPISLPLLLRLSERGILFESYINGVLWRRPVITKDVFELWQELGLSTKGYGYGSRLAAKMRVDLDTIAAASSSLLERYEFSDSKTRARSKNLVLYRKARMPRLPRSSYGDEALDEVDIQVEQIRSMLRDASNNDSNIRRIAERMPAPVIDKGVFDAWGRYRDRQTSNPAAYFVGIMKKKAIELDIDLGMGRRSKQEGGRGEIQHALETPSDCRGEDVVR